MSSTVQGVPRASLAPAAMRPRSLLSFQPIHLCERSNRLVRFRVQTR